MKEELISPLAVVSPEAKIGTGTKIAPFAVIEGDVEIGEGTVIHSGVMVRNGARIGSGCEIHPYAVIGGIPQDLKFQGEKSIAVVGDRSVV